MTQAPERFFPQRADREVLDDVLRDFPFPLVLTYARLHEEMDRQEPVAAAWHMRDALECALKFSATLAVADFLQTNPSPEDAKPVLNTLLNPRGVLVSGWHFLIDKALSPLKDDAQADRLGESGRLLPELFNAFFTVTPGGLKANRLFVRLGGNDENFVSWRNEHFGHGAFRNDRRFYADQTNLWLPRLHEFYAALRPELAGWELISVRPGGEQVRWHGSLGLPPVEPHTHVPSGESVPMFLAGGAEHLGARLRLTPLLSVQPCETCKQPTAFFFDKYQHKGKHYRTSLLEYFGGHSDQQRDWEEMDKLRAKLPPDYVYERGTYDQKEVEERVEAVFRDFDTDYLPPEYLTNAFWDVVDNHPKGYVHLSAPEGIGKTYLVRGLVAEGPERDAPVLAYHILPGALTDYRTFVSQLADRAREQLRYRTNEIQIKVATIKVLQQQFVEAVEALMKENNLRTLVVAIDALPNPEDGSAAITDFLPPPALLPDRCFVLLTSRDALRSKARETLDDLRKKGRLTTETGVAVFETIRVSPETPGNQQLVRAYLRRRLTKPYNTSEHVETVLARSGGVLLYAYHFARALDTGVFPDPTSLPDGSQFYPEYLRKLRARVGDRFFETVYLPALLLLSAVRRPVTFIQLRDWGIPEDRLQSALFDIADFLRVHRARGWHDSLSTEEENRYELAHEAFVRYVSEDSELRARLRETHAGVARSALNRWSGRWREADPTGDGDLYDLRYVLYHLREAGMTEQEAVLRADEEYASACWDAGSLAQEMSRHRIALELYDQTAAVYRYLLDSGRTELANDLAAALVNGGNSLQQLGRLTEAVEAFDEAIVIRRRLVESGRTEIANDLASALMNKVRVLEKLELWDDALACYEESIRWRERCVEAGMLHLLPELLRTIRFRVMTLLDLGRLQEAGSDVARLMEHVYVKLRSESPPQPVLEEIGWMLGRLMELQPEQREEVYLVLSHTSR